MCKMLERQTGICPLAIAIRMSVSSKQQQWYQQLSELSHYTKPLFPVISPTSSQFSPSPESASTKSVYSLPKALHNRL